MKLASRTFAVVVLALAGLSVPGRDPDPDRAPVSGRTFIWDQDSLWLALESRYAAARDLDCELMSDSIETRMHTLAERSTGLASTMLGYDHPVFASLEAEFFGLAPAVAACPNHTARYIDTYQIIREEVKNQSVGWDMSDTGVRRRLYRSLYGGRAALEEVMLQHPDEVETLVEGREEPSVTPSAEIQGFRIHSGDILVSRGGYPTSALISRGSDYPGNFSHIALAHVDEETSEISVVEAHIEIGVAVASAEQYLQDKKLRIMVLRPRADLPALVDDPMLPHRAATIALERARAGHIAYDFEMDYRDPSKLFCSEVASAAYREVGITLWMGRSTITSEGLRRWLASFGVRHFETQEPSDLEYDPQLTVVGEWRDPATLFKDHLDNAVIDAMLEGAERGDELSYAWYRLAPARIAKGYSWTRNRFGSVGPVPEGMNAAAALRNQAFTERHGRIADRVSALAADFERSAGYPPPYWQLVALAQQVVSEGL
jgi:hypothetical protein